MRPIFYILQYKNKEGGLLAEDGGDDRKHLEQNKMN